MNKFNRNPFKYLYILLLLIILSTVITTFFGINLFYDELKTRYLGHILNFSNPDFDWIFLGTSRTLTSINPIELDKMIFLNKKSKINSVNLSLQHSSRFIDYCILKQYLNNARVMPKKIFIEVSNLERREIPIPNYPKFSNIFIVLKDIIQKNYKFSKFTAICYLESLYHGPQDIFNFIFDRLNLYDNLENFYLKKGFLESDNIFNFENNNNDFSELKANILSNQHLKHITYYSKKIIDLCKKNNINEIYFVFVPGYNEYDLSDEQKIFYSKYGKIIYPSEEINQKNNYRDITHLNLNGATILTESIYSYIYSIERLN